MTTLPIRITDEQFKAALRDELTVQQPVETRVKNDRLPVAVQDQSTGATGSLWVPLGAR